MQCIHQNMNTMDIPAILLIFGTPNFPYFFLNSQNAQISQHMSITCKRLAKFGKIVKTEKGRKVTEIAKVVKRD